MGARAAIAPGPAARLSLSTRGISQIMAAMTASETSQMVIVADGGNARFRSGMVSPATMPATRVDVLSTGMTRLAARVS